MKTEIKKIEHLKVELNKGETIKVKTNKGIITITAHGVTSQIKTEINDPNKNKVKSMNIHMYDNFMTAHARFNGEDSKLGEHEVTKHEDDSEFYHFEASNDCFLSYSKDKIKEKENK